MLKKLLLTFALLASVNLAIGQNWGIPKCVQDGFFPDNWTDLGLPNPSLDYEGMTFNCLWCEKFMNAVETILSDQTIEDEVNQSKLMRKHFYQFCFHRLRTLQISCVRQFGGIFGVWAFARLVSPLQKRNSLSMDCHHANFAKPSLIATLKIIENTFKKYNLWTLN